MSPDTRLNGFTPSKTLAWHLVVERKAARLVDVALVQRHHLSSVTTLIRHRAGTEHNFQATT